MTGAKCEEKKHQAAKDAAQVLSTHSLTARLSAIMRHAPAARQALSAAGRVSMLQRRQAPLQAQAARALHGLCQDHLRSPGKLFAPCMPSAHMRPALLVLMSCACQLIGPVRSCARLLQRCQLAQAVCALCMACSRTSRAED